MTSNNICSLVGFDVLETVSDNVELFPYAKGFFNVVFTSEDEQDLILSKLWLWGNHSLSTKPWTISFNPLTEPLNVHPAWNCLPNLPLHFWENSLFEAIGNSIGHSLMVDEAKTEVSQSSLAHILDLGISTSFLDDAVLMVEDRP